MLDAGGDDEVGRLGFNLVWQYFCYTILFLHKEIGCLVSQELNSYSKDWGLRIDKDGMILLSTELKLASALEHLNRPFGFLHFYSLANVQVLCSTGMQIPQQNCLPLSNFGHVKLGK